MRTFFVDVVIPLAVPKPLTYRVPAEWEMYIQEGSRVIVPLGKSKKYTGIIWRVHEEVPKELAAKYIDEVVDDSPIITKEQKVLWEWIAQYYACSLGEIMAAALPTGLKLSSETIYVTKENTDVVLDANEELLIEYISKKNKGMGTSIQEMNVHFSALPISKLIRGLLKKGAISSLEEVKEKYIPKRMTYIRLNELFSSDEKLSELFAQLEKRNAEKQNALLIAFIQLSKWNGTCSEAVRKKELLELSKADNSAVQALVKKGVFCIEERNELRMLGEGITRANLPSLSEEQNEAFQKINSFTGPSLLFGVTSSGKTEVYIHLIEEQLKRGRQVLFLLPEIALTSHLIHRIQEYFGEQVGVYHSGYSTHERTEVWHRVLGGKYRFNVVLGARSSLFLPFENLGLIIVDEEHESTFKQQDPAPRYQGRDAAVKLATIHQVPMVLGSATPAIESYHNAIKERYQLVELKNRFGGSKPPKVVLVNMKLEQGAKRVVGTFSQTLLDEIANTVKAGNQVILFQNRRGYTPLWECVVCHHIPECKNCDVSLTFHKSTNQLKCHYCGYVQAPPTQCPACAVKNFKMMGAGTERIEEEILEFLPSVRVARMDTDVARGKHAHKQILTDFEEGKIDVLVGTQMVTKGLDFSKVQLVGILNADRMMKHPDFRSLERAYQLMVQVAGRSGRRKEEGRVLIQTYDTEHWLFPYILDNDYTGFYRVEINEREQHAYPPFKRMIKLTVKHKDRAVLHQASQRIYSWLKAAINGSFYGPEEPYISRINNYYIRVFWIRIPKVSEHLLIKEFLKDCKTNLLLDNQFKMVRFGIDVDPL
jgi:primosomal protein N' (replication factor Y) (superfamily II helicase)